MLTTILIAAAWAYLFLSLLALAPKKSGYSHLKHTISEVGEIGAPHQRFVALGVFLPIGILTLLSAYLILPASLPVATLASCISIGYLGAAVFPCDPGSPPTGSLRQGLHNLSGGVEYIGGGLSLITISEDSGQLFKLAGFLVFAVAIALTAMPSSSNRGIVQRVAEICLFGGLTLSAWLVETPVQ